LKTIQKPAVLFEIPCEVKAAAEARWIEEQDAIHASKLASIRTAKEKEDALRIAKEAEATLEAELAAEQAAVEEKAKAEADRAAEKQAEAKSIREAKAREEKEQADAAKRAKADREAAQQRADVEAERQRFQAQDDEKKRAAEKQAQVLTILAVKEAAEAQAAKNKIEREASVRKPEAGLLPNGLAGPSGPPPLPRTGSLTSPEIATPAVNPFNSQTLAKPSVITPPRKPINPAVFSNPPTPLDQSVPAVPPVVPPPVTTTPPTPANPVVGPAFLQPKNDA
jgi:hypothetical protein